MNSTALPQFNRYKNTLLTLALICLPPLFWAGNFIAGRSVRGDIPPISLNFFRWLIAALVLLPFTLGMLKQQRELYWQHRKKIFIASALGICAFNSLIYLGLQTTTANNAIILNAFIPLLISLFGALFFSLQLTWRHWLGMSVSFAGVIVIVTQGSLELLLHFHLNAGDAWVFVATLCWAAYTLLLKTIPPQINRYGLMSAQILIGLVLLAPFFIVELSHAQPLVWSKQSLWALAYVGIVPSVLAYLIYTASIGKLGAAKAGASINLLPVFGVLLSVLLLGESIHYYQLTGMALIFTGLFFSSGK
ncbi:DMT family transporter [Reinekea thalattae]|uniref:DMT family transporter n=1 Tax=Reinekea thalattae TaxID=2593301 RepID=A0A5C8ZCD8_9GAMM|nr:DMT family transporter [Reinekea thalattae]TXR54510.1 DMT family transporter [Reinekea thalattae]